ncbi:hypothetical protein ABZP36_021920 [Zizania latifolia]
MCLYRLGLDANHPICKVWLLNNNFLCMQNLRERMLNLQEGQGLRIRSGEVEDMDTVVDMVVDMVEDMAVLGMVVDMVILGTVGDMAVDMAEVMVVPVMVEDMAEDMAVDMEVDMEVDMVEDTAEAEVAAMVVGVTEEVGINKWLISIQHIVHGYMLNKSSMTYFHKMYVALMKSL